MKLSIIVPCFNAAGTLGSQLSALVNQQWSDGWEVIITDNGSSDGSIKIAERFRDRLPNFSIVDSSDRRGAAHARNVAARAASGEALIFCDADDEVAAGWLLAMGEALSKQDFVACRVDFKKLNPAWVQELFKDHAQQHGKLLKVWFPPYLSHAGAGTLGVRKSLHEAIGGFDESLRAHEDTDYCFRIQQKGVELYFVPDAVLHIRSHHTLSELFRQACLWAEYSILLYKRYRPSDSKEMWRWRAFMTQCKNLIYSLPQIHSKAGRALWTWHLGWQLGRIRGSIRFQVPPV